MNSKNILWDGYDFIFDSDISEDEQAKYSLLREYNMARCKNITDLENPDFIIFKKKEVESIKAELSYIDNLIEEKEEEIHSLKDDKEELKKELEKYTRV